MIKIRGGNDNKSTKAFKFYDFEGFCVQYNGVYTVLWNGYFFCDCTPRNNYLYYIYTRCQLIETGKPVL